MRIVFFTRAGFGSDQLFLYMFSRVAERLPDVYVVAVSPSRGTMKWLLAGLARRWRKLRRLGVLKTLELLSSYPLQVFFASRDRAATERVLQQLPRATVPINPDRVVYVETPNGVDAVEAMRTLEPDVIVQAGAGILRPRVFKAARLGTVNLHHGIAPLIRGMDSIYWAMWEKRPDWIGSTVHWIDEGIDTGEVIAYASVAPLSPGQGYPALFGQATQRGVDQLVEALVRLASGQTSIVQPPACKGVYRSTMSGWRHLILRARMTLGRRVAVRGAGEQC